MKDFNNKLEAFFSKIENRIKTHVPQIIGETAVEDFKNNFVNKSFYGQAWQPYKNKAREPRRGSLMMRTNALFNSIRPQYSAGRVRVYAGNSRVPYARRHNEGERVSGTYQVKAFTNRNFMGTGKAVQIRAHRRTVDFITPKRQFMGKHPQLLANIKTRFKNTFKHF